MNHTLIKRAKNPDGTQGYTWNPITGCLNHENGLCKGGGFPCYAFRLANGRLKQRYLAQKTWPLTAGLKDHPSADPFYPRFWEERLGDIPLKPPRGIFVCDMGELFGDWLPRDWQDRIFNIIKGNPQHRFYLLTKQPQNLIKWSPFPPNCDVGVTVTSNGAMTLALESLAYIEAKVRFISFDPLLGFIGMADHMSIKGIVDWIIIGSQTKPYKPPKIEWVEEIARAADKAGVKVFLKENLWKLIPPVSGILGQYKQNKDGINFYLRQDVPNP
jgi:protein gp37